MHARTISSPKRPLDPDGSSSSKRLNPFEEAKEAKRQRLDLTRPAEKLSTWRSALPFTDFQERARAEALLGFIAAGVAFPRRPGDEQRLFNALIQAEAYDVFVEVFHAFNRIPWTDMQEGNRPETFRLELQLPAEWQPASTSRMVQAFKQIPARQVAVLPQPSDEKNYYWIPPAACDCLVAMLESDTRSVVQVEVEGPMNIRRGLTNAMENSALQSINLGWTDTRQGPDEEGLEAYRDLVRGCRWVRHIGIDHPALLSLHTVIRDFPSPGSGLSSVTFDLGENQPVPAGPWNKDLQLQDFIKAAGEFQTLTKVEGTAGVVDGESLKVNFIEPLTGSPSLDTVSIDGDQSLPTDPSTLNVLPMVATFSTTCPSLTQFEWRAGELRFGAGDDMRDLVRRGGDLAMATATTTVMDAMAHPNFRLQSLTLNGLPLASGVLNAFISALKTNKTIRHLDLRGCHIDLRSALQLLDILKDNTTLETVQLPTECENYYFVTGDGEVHGFQENGLESDAESGPDEPPAFRPVSDARATAAQRVLAFAEFGPLQHRANRLFAEIAAHNRRAVVRTLNGLEAHRPSEG